MTAATFERPAGAELLAAADAVNVVIHDYATRVTDDPDDLLGYFLAGVAFAGHLGVSSLESWVLRARVVGATWQQIADALGTTKGNAHGQFRYVDFKLKNGASR